MYQPRIHSGVLPFNEHEGNPIPALFGSVTTGEIRHFLHLTAQTLTIDSARSYLDNLGLLLGELDTIATAVIANQGNSA